MLTGEVFDAATAAAGGLVDRCVPDDEVDAAVADAGLDYFCTGPVWETPTKPGRAGVGLELPRYAAQQAGDKPFFAIGGVDTARLPSVLDTGASRIVVVRAVTDAQDVTAAARALRAPRWSRGCPPRRCGWCCRWC